VVLEVEEERDGMGAAGRAGGEETEGVEEE